MKRTNYTYKELAILLKQHLGDARQLNDSIPLLTLSNIIKINYQTIISNLDNYVNNSDLEVFNDAIERLINKEPISYILNNIDFFNENYYLTNQVLIPRPETELLVSKALEIIDTIQKPSKILEVGTGSGCISISILNNSQNKSFKIKATDNSLNAIKIAQMNVKRNLQPKDQGRLELLKHNIFSDIISDSFDIILSNPPYIPIKEFIKLDKSISYEPRTALTDDGDGLKFYKRLAELLDQNTNTLGIGLFEIHSTNAKATKNLFKKRFQNRAMYKIIKDIFNRDRLLIIQKV